MKTQPLFSQDWSEVTGGERNAIVFERLNQRYGAYEIRVNYDRTLLKAFSATSLLILLLSAYLLISALFLKVETIIPTTNGQIELFFPPKEKIPELPKAPELPKINSTPITNLQPTVTTDPTNDDVLPKNPNSNLSSTSNSKDTTGGPGIISDKKGGGPLFPEDTATRTIADLIEIPRFPGGDENLYLFLKNNTHIPQELIEIGEVREKVGITFVIDKDGSITNAMILQKGSKYMQLNNEAMRVIKKMPKWEPGRQNGNPVKVQMVLPIRFEVK
jgi:protein TonB